MMHRCYNPKTNNFAQYGGAGIKVVRRWHKFENFLADMGEPPVGHVLDRKKNDKHYCPNNCRWATFKQSTENRSNTVWLGKMRVADIARIHSIPAGRIYNRLRFGWTLEEIVSRKERMNGFNRHGIPTNPHGYTTKFSDAMIAAGREG